MSILSLNTLADHPIIVQAANRLPGQSDPSQINCPYRADY